MAEENMCRNLILKVSSAEIRLALSILSPYRFVCIVCRDLVGFLRLLKTMRLDVGEVYGTCSRIEHMEMSTHTLIHLINLDNPF